MARRERWTRWGANGALVLALLPVLLLPGRPHDARGGDGGPLASNSSVATSSTAPGAHLVHERAGGQAKIDPRSPTPRLFSDLADLGRLDRPAHSATMASKSGGPGTPDVLAGGRPTGRSPPPHQF